MQTKIEKTIQAIADKQRLRDWVDALPEGANGVVITRIACECQEPDCCGEVFRFAYIGDITLAESLWAIKTFENHLMGNV